MQCDRRACGYLLFCLVIRFPLDSSSVYTARMYLESRRYTSNSTRSDIFAPLREIVPRVSLSNACQIFCADMREISCLELGLPPVSNHTRFYIHFP
ncbi:hypothetical protein B0H13DRAFT_2091031 [Mycena leptocephala]|nr:hypothetical protein B0H13DRAFT_2091031 [Mycena leptocephala]